MTWAWGDTIDASTNLQDPDLNAIIRAAVHERLLASGLNLTFSASPPSFTTGTRANKATTPAVQLNASSLAWTAEGTITQCQQILSAICHVFVRRDLYPSGLAGATSFPSDLCWTRQTLAEALGYPIEPLTPANGRPHWRRRMPRRIFAASATTSQYLNHIGGSPPYSLVNLATCATGDKAQYYSGGVVAGTPIRGASDVPGKYRGINEYQGSGTWDQVPGGAGYLADTLDSDVVSPSSDWCRGGYFAPGDYWGYWLYRDIVEACKLMTWTCPLVTTVYSSFDAAGINKYLLKTFGSGTDYATAADAHAAGVAGVAAASPSTVVAGIPRVHSRVGPASPDPYEWEAINYQTSKFWIAADDQYEGIDRDIEYLAYDNTAQFYDHGYAITSGQYSVIDTDSLAAGAHAWDLQGKLVADYPDPLIGTPGNSNQLDFVDVQMVYKWGFTYA